MHVLGIVERGGALRLFVLERLGRANIEHIVKKTLSEVETIYTDMCQKLHFLGSLYPHETVHHWIAYINGRAHVNNCENVFSLFEGC